MERKNVIIIVVLIGVLLLATVGAVNYITKKNNERKAKEIINDAFNYGKEHINPTLIIKIVK